MIKKKKKSGGKPDSVTTDWLKECRRKAAEEIERCLAESLASKINRAQPGDIVIHPCPSGGAKDKEENNEKESD